MAGRSTRFIFSDNGSLIEVTQELHSYFTAAYVFPSYTAGQDYLYIGSYFPFNNFFVKVSSANAVSANLLAHIWDGREWKACVDIIDQTSLAGVALAQDGIISWTKDKNHTWSREDTNNQGQSVLGLETKNIYDLFWVRLSWSANLTAGTSIKYMGQKFSDDYQLGAEYPDLDTAEARQAFNQGLGKNDWEEQTVVAAQAIITDLKVSNTIVDSAQIIEWDILTRASMHKTAEIIYSAFGPDYEEHRKKAQDAYRREMDNSFKRLDENQDATINVNEMSSPNLGRIYR